MPDSVPTGIAGSEWHLLHAVTLNVVVLLCTWRFSRRCMGAEILSTAGDTLCLWFLVQYLSVVVPGLLGILNRWTISVMALAACTAMWWLSARRPSQSTSAPLPRLDAYAVWGCTLLLLGYMAAMIYHQQLMPPMGDDGLAYHLPAAVRWLQSGRLVLHEIWFLNPAATFSPLLGSAVAAWWLAPLGNDWLARFMQGPALVFVFFTMAEFCRLLGARPAVAALVALAAVLSRPLVSQVIVVKDDLYLCGFFLATIVAVAQSLNKDPLGPWKLGLALGLTLATKITALMALPMLLLLADVPWRAGWRVGQWLIALSLPAALAGPWYVRNLVLTGNPLYPADVSVGGVHLLPGMFQMARSEQFHSLAGTWHVLTGTYFGMPRGMLIALGIVWLASALLLCRQAVRQPLSRLLLLGPPVGLAIFIGVNQFPEVRYAYPAMLLLFGAVALLARYTAQALGAILAAGLILADILTAFENRQAVGFVLAGAGLALLGQVAKCTIRQRHFARSGVRLSAWAGAGLVLFVLAYIHQDALLLEYARAADTAWADPQLYGTLGQAWAFVRQQLPPRCTLAYTNTHLVYPLFGFQLGRRVLYAPTRRGVHNLWDLPTVNGPVSGEHLVKLVVAPVLAEPDQNAWMANLRRLRAEYLFIVKDHFGLSPPELHFTSQDPQRFELLFNNDAAAVYRIRS